MSLSPYLQFSRENWRKYRDGTPLPLTETELASLRGFNESISIAEVEDIYLPLSRLLNLYVTQTQNLHAVTNQFLHQNTHKMPYIIGVSGSVAVGKSTTSRILQTVLSRWSHHPKVALVSTDGFLYPNAVLKAKGLMKRKGFPESYNREALLQFLNDLKSGKAEVTVPVYSHANYDIIDEVVRIPAPDILIIEGLNILQMPDSAEAQRIYVSDFIDFNIFVTAPTAMIKSWFLERFRSFRKHALDKPHLYFHQFSRMDEAEAIAFADGIWESINAPNLLTNILPYQCRAQLILEKGADHGIEQVYLRKL
ncbi:MAG: type pantothenate kinase [Gammaproteobacteria bacterium]|nr:type pantothenate kinase [Gammaproteobacteria bacterium]